MSHKSIPAQLAQSKHLPSDLVRLSVGIEEADDLLEDLEQALEVAPWVGARSGSGCGVRASSGEFFERPASARGTLAL